MPHAHAGLGANDALNLEQKSTPALRLRMVSHRKGHPCRLCVNTEQYNHLRSHVLSPNFTHKETEIYTVEYWHREEETDRGF